MLLDPDTFLVALYSIVDDVYRAHFAARKPRRPGPKPRLSDSEVLTLVIISQWFGSSERKFVRYAHRHWLKYFPELLSQSATNRRARDLGGVMIRMVPLIAARLQETLPMYQALDGVPVPVARICRARRHRLFADETGLGKGGSDRHWYFGCELLLSVTEEGVITGFLLGPAGSEERWLADAFFCWRTNPEGMPWTKEDIPPSNKRTSADYVGPKGPIWPREAVGDPNPVIYISDGNFSGPIWTEHWRNDYGVRILTRKCFVGASAERFQTQLSGLRQIIETVNSHLEGDLHLHFPGAHCLRGLMTRIGAKLVAFNLGIWLNKLLGRPSLAIGTLACF